MAAEDVTLDRLLDLDGEVLEVGGGYWVNITATRVAADTARPFGVAYSLSLFGPDDQTVIRYDNAHPVSIGSGPAKRQSETGDHVHRGGVVKPYAYSDAETLLVDFWNDVYRVLEEEGVP
jgi:hypothetical protein